MGHIMMTTLPHVWNVGLSPLSLWFGGDSMVPSPNTAAGTVAWNSPCGMTWAVPSVSVLMSAPAVTSLSDWLADELWLVHIGRILMLICWLMLYLFFVLMIITYTTWSTTEASPCFPNDILAWFECSNTWAWCGSMMWEAHLNLVVWPISQQQVAELTFRGWICCRCVFIIYCFFWGWWQIQLQSAMETCDSIFAKVWVSAGLWFLSA